MKMLQVDYDYLMEVTEIISLNVRSARKRAELTQEIVAKRCGITTHHYADIEAGRRKPSVDLLFNLGLALGVSGSDLLETTEKPLPLPYSPRKALEKYLVIPDEVVELASCFDSSDDVWEDIIETLNIAIAQKEIYKG